MRTYENDANACAFVPVDCWRLRRLSPDASLMECRAASEPLRLLARDYGNRRWCAESTSTSRGRIDVRDCIRRRPRHPRNGEPRLLCITRAVKRAITSDGNPIGISKPVFGSTMEIAAETVDAGFQIALPDTFRTPRWRPARRLRGRLGRDSRCSHGRSGAQGDKRGSIRRSSKTSSSSRTRATRAARELTPTFANIRRRCVETVQELIPRRAAIVLFA